MRASKVQNVHQETQMHPGELAVALKFWGFFDSKRFGQSQRKEK
jgi:hypothetical protein